MERRTLLKTVGSIGAASAVGGAGLMATSGGAAAEVGDIDLGSASITTDDGTITSFTISPDVSVEYDGLDEEAVGIVCQVYVLAPEGAEGPGGQILTQGTVGYGPQNRIQVEDEESLNTHAGTYTYDFPELDVLGSDIWDAEDFAEGDEGETNETEVGFLVKFAVRGETPDGSSLQTIDPPGEVNREASLTVSVTNEQATNSADANSDSNIEGENQEN